MTDLIERDAAIAAIVKEGGAKDSTPCEILRRIPAATTTGTRPSIDWSHVAQEFNWLARDADGDGHAYTHKPEVGDFQFLIDDGKWTHAEAFASYSPGNCDWRDSLVMRPGHVEGLE